MATETMTEPNFALTPESAHDQNEAWLARRIAERAARRLRTGNANFSMTRTQPSASQERLLGSPDAQEGRIPQDRDPSRQQLAPRAEPQRPATARADQNAVTIVGQVFEGAEVGKRCLIGDNEFEVIAIDGDAMSLRKVRPTDLSEIGQAHKVARRLNPTDRPLDEIADNQEFYR